MKRIVRLSPILASLILFGNDLFAKQHASNLEKQRAAAPAVSPQNRFDGTWTGRLTGLSGEMPYVWDVTLVVSGNLLNSTLTGGTDHSTNPWHSRDKLTFDGHTMRTASIKGDWRLTLNADGRTAVVTVDCGFLCNMGRDHWSGTFTRVGAVASSDSQVATPASVKPNAVSKDLKGDQTKTNTQSSGTLAVVCRRLDGPDRTMRLHLTIDLAAKRVSTQWYFPSGEQWGRHFDSPATITANTVYWREGVGENYPDEWSYDLKSGRLTQTLLWDDHSSHGLSCQ